MTPAPRNPERDAERSRTMRAVKSANTRPEMTVRRLVFRMGYRYRLHCALPGKPDLVFSSRRKVIFVHGCFWHGHDCPRGARLPNQNAAYWHAKISGNRIRDAKTTEQLTADEWQVLVIWECELRDPRSVQATLETFLRPNDTRTRASDETRTRSFQRGGSTSVESPGVVVAGRSLKPMT